MRNKKIDTKKLLERLDNSLIYRSFCQFKNQCVKSGMTYCPFHQDKTPSLSVDFEKGKYYCFGCTAKGDTITFIMKVLNKTFPEALSYLINTLHDYQKEDLLNTTYSAVKKIKTWTVLDLFDLENFTNGFTLDEIRNNVNVQERLDKERAERAAKEANSARENELIESYTDLSGYPCSKEQSQEIDLQIIEEYFKESFKKFKKFIEKTQTNRYLELDLSTQTLMDKSSQRRVPNIMFKALKYIKQRFESTCTM